MINLDYELRPGGSDDHATPPLVFTHGWANDRSVWTGIIDELGAERRTVSWDLRGHGGSDAPPPGNYRRTDALDDLRRMVDHAGRPAVLVGHSLGGYLSLAYAINHADEVAGLVLVATGPGFRSETSRADWNQWVQDTAATIDLPPGAEEISLHEDAYVIDHLDQVTCPVLLVLGERDRRFAAATEMMQKTLDVRSVLIVPEAGHMVHAKNAAVVASAIDHFLVES